MINPNSWGTLQKKNTHTPRLVSCNPRARESSEEAKGDNKHWKLGTKKATSPFGDATEIPPSFPHYKRPRIHSLLLHSFIHANPNAQNPWFPVREFMVIGWELRRASMLAKVSHHFIHSNPVYQLSYQFNFQRVLWWDYGLPLDSILLLMMGNVLFLLLCATAKIDVNVDFTHKLCASLMLPPLRFLFHFIPFFPDKFHWFIDWLIESFLFLTVMAVAVLSLS